MDYVVFTKSNIDSGFNRPFTEYNEHDLLNIFFSMQYIEKWTNYVLMTILLSIYLCAIHKQNLYSITLCFSICFKFHDKNKSVPQDKLTKLSGLLMFSPCHNDVSAFITEHYKKQVCIVHMLLHA